MIAQYDVDEVRVGSRERERESESERVGVHIVHQVVKLLMTPTMSREAVPSSHSLATSKVAKYICMITHLE